MPSRRSLNEERVAHERTEHHAQLLVIDGEPIPVLDLRGLLDTKQHCERPKDQANAALLREALARLSTAPPSDI